MPNETSQIILWGVNVLYIACSCTAITLVIHRWLRGLPLVPFTPRREFEIGGIFTWLRRFVALSRGEQSPLESEHVFSRTQFLADVRIGVIGFLTAFLPMILIHVYCQQFIPYKHPSIEEVKQNPAPALYLQVALRTIIFAPILEELLFRNLLQGILEVYERIIMRSLKVGMRWVFGAIPILLSSLAFAGMHWDHGAAAIPLFPFAMMLGYLYFQTHRLTPSVVAHAMLNLFTMINLWFLT